MASTLVYFVFLSFTFGVLALEPSSYSWTFANISEVISPVTGNLATAPYTPIHFRFVPSYLADLVIQLNATSNDGLAGGILTFRHYGSWNFLFINWLTFIIEFRLQRLDSQLHYSSPASSEFKSTANNRPRYNFFSSGLLSFLLTWFTRRSVGLLFWLLAGGMAPKHQTPISKHVILHTPRWFRHVHYFELECDRLPRHNSYKSLPSYLYVQFQCIRGYFAWTFFFSPDPNWRQ